MITNFFAHIIYFMKTVLQAILLITTCTLFINCTKKSDTGSIQTPVDTVVKPPVVLPYKLVWSEEFNYTGAPDTSKWSYDVGGNGWGNHELEYYTNARLENARVENGNLVIEARKESFGGKGYTSARLLTKHKAEFTYGIFEIRAKIPHGNGTWPAIWTLSAHDPLMWPDDGEIDIMEAIGSNPNIIYGTCHNTSYHGATGRGSTTSIASAPDSFHIYKIEWTPTEIDWYVDGNQYYSYLDPKTGPSSWPYYKDFFMILNVAVGGDFGGQKGVDDSAFPQQMLVDYVRVYQRK
ncbi:MAG: hypothetical protein NVSMB45_12350 [Ginsengibacter sp.]